MSPGQFIVGSLRAVLVAAAAGIAAFGLLVVFQPFGRSEPAPPALVVSDAPAAAALQGRIEALRLSLRQTEAAIATPPAPIATPASDARLRATYEAQIAAATERRDLARRQAGAIRQALDAGINPSSLAAIRDSVMVGQLLSQQAALDARLAEQGARLRASHPIMLALTAQRNALSIQIRQEAANIASALEAEATIDDAQIDLLDAQLPAADTSPIAASDTGLAMQAATQRAELDGLVDAYFNIPPATVSAATPAAAPTNPLSLVNLIVVGVAAAAALLFQMLLAFRRQRAPDPVLYDIAAWAQDHDPEIVAVDAFEPLRQAS